MPPVHLLIKPASGNCNMACRYCFYRDEVENRETDLYGAMSNETMKNVIRRTFDFAEEACTFAFQGGEPTLAGLLFFRAFTDEVEHWNKKRIKVSYAIQTNGYALTKEWAEFFHKHRFLVGLSLDGNREAHDALRLDHKGKGTFSKVMQAAKLLDSYRVEYNILTVVTAQLAQNIGKVYPFYIRNGFLYQQYIPCLDAIGEKRGLQDYSLTPQVYGKFLMELFDLWYIDIKNRRPVSIRYFDNLIMMLRDIPPEACGMMGFCMIQNVVEASGTVYPCDFYALDGYELGNLNEVTFDAIYENRMKSGFLQKSRIKPEPCSACKWQKICRGGCRRDRDNFDGGDLDLNYFCEAYQMFFEHAFSRLMELASGRF